MSAVRYVCSNHHVWLVRPPLGRKPWQWTFCEKCGLSAESELHLANAKPITDKKGRLLKPGDIVEFYFSADFPLTDDDTGDTTRMVDIVEKIEGWLYFACPALNGSGAYAIHFASRCVRLGHISELNKDSLRRKIKAEELADIFNYLGKEENRGRK